MLLVTYMISISTMHGPMNMKNVETNVCTTVISDSVRTSLGTTVAN